MTYVSYKKIFQESCQELFYLKQISVPGYLFSMKGMQEISNCQFHDFFDVCKQAYRNAVYKYFTTRTDSITDGFIISH